jgi:hypothetical protein
MVGHRYGVSEVRMLFDTLGNILTFLGAELPNQRSFPVRFIDHPFLFDLEVAKIQTLWHILHRNGREQLASVLCDILSVRLRKDYAVGHLFSAGYLEDNFPELESNYWELLRGPTDSYNTTFSATAASPPQGSSRAHSEPCASSSSLPESSAARAESSAEENAFGFQLPGELDDDNPSQQRAYSDHDSRFRDERQIRFHVHCPDFVPHGPDVA